MSGYIYCLLNAELRWDQWTEVPTLLYLLPSMRVRYMYNIKISCDWMEMRGSEISAGQMFHIVSIDQEKNNTCKSYFKCGCLVLSTLRPSYFVVSWNVKWDHPMWTISNLKSTILFQGAGFPPGLPKGGGAAKKEGVVTGTMGITTTTVAFPTIAIASEREKTCFDE